MVFLDNAIHFPTSGENFESNIIGDCPYFPRNELAGYMYFISKRASLINIRVALTNDSWKFVGVINAITTISAPRSWHQNRRLLPRHLHLEYLVYKLL